MTNNARSHIYTVSKLNRFAKHILESEIGQVWISAEISNFVAAASGHWYFTLKDERAQLKSAMFRNSNRLANIKPKNGDKVLVRGNVSLYEPRGDFQLIVSHIEPEGEGLLKQQFDMIKQKLAAEGLFSNEHKKTLPANPNTIGVITSDTGAAFQDIIQVLQRRNPGINIILYPSQVQGDTAPQQLRSALQNAISRNETDVIIIGRGGGSMEDLWCFNDEQLARAIFACPIPIISAVGHEIDFTIADFVADLRAPTPSAAAEQASAPLQASFEQLIQLRNRLRDNMVRRYQYANHQQLLLEQKLQNCHPRSQLQQQQQTIDRLTLALNHHWVDTCARKAMHLQQVQARLAQQHPKHQLKQLSQRLQFLSTQLERNASNQLSQKQQKLGNLLQMLDTVSPLATLARGYSATFKNGQIVKQAHDLTVGDTISTRLGKGEVFSTVTKVE